VLVFEREGERVEVPVAGELTLGRTADNDVRLAVDGVSRRHLRLLRRGEAVVAVDLGSSNGTLLGGRRLEPGVEASFAPGDVLRVGAAELRLVGAAAEPAPAAEVEAADAVDLLLETIADLHRSQEPTALLPRIVDRVIELAGAERGLLLLQGADGLETSVARTRGGEDLERVEGTSRSIPAEVIRTGEAVCITGTAPSDWSQASESMRDHDLRAILCVPIRLRGTIRGVIYVDSQEAATGFGERERGLLEALAAQCAISLERAEVRRDERDERLRLERENAALRGGEPAARPLAVSPAMEEALRRVERVAASDVTLLITGETGVGKEVLARYAHDRSDRRARPFVVVDCGAIPESLLESVLFGHVEGAFTGATRDSQGLVGRAHGGTVLLDEVGELPLNLQPKLLRFLEERSFLPVGSGERRQADVRIVACTHRDLEAMVAAGTFREDLFFRLNAYPVQVPPLRERREDIGPLAQLLLARERGGANAPGLTGFTHEAREALRAYDWPGNVRELAHRLQRACVTAEPPFITVTDLDLQAAPGGAVGVLPLPEARKRATARFEQEYVTELLRRHAGQVRRAAQEAGVSRQMFQRLMAKHGISRRAFLAEE